jgi:hypothetical protein
MHAHSGLSRSQYGFSAEDAYSEMIFGANLDFGAITDYDWALATDNSWGDVKTAANRFHCPAGATDCYTEIESVEGHERLKALGDRPFVTILGYEWNNQAGPTEESPNAEQYGHKNVYFFNENDPEADYLHDEACVATEGCIPLITSGYGEPEDGGENWGNHYHPCTLWETLASWREAETGLLGITVPHHVALSVTLEEGEDENGRTKPASTDWSVHPSQCDLNLEDPQSLEPLVELTSVWGNSERAGMNLDEDPVDGLADDSRVIREVALSAEPRHRLGFIGSGDNHSGFPGIDPPHSFLLDPTGQFRNYTFYCANAADCTQRFGQTGWVGVLLDPEVPLSRSSVFDALTKRHTVATTGEPFELVLRARIDGQDAGIGGDQVSVGAVSSLTVELSVDLGELALDEATILVGSPDGSWTEFAADKPLALIDDGQATDGIGDHDWIVYGRVAAMPRGGITLPKGAVALAVFEATGGAAEISVTPGQYTAQSLIDALHTALDDAVGLELNYTVTHGEADEDLFEIVATDPQSGATVGIHLNTSVATDWALALGFQDNRDTPPEAELFCSPCTGAVAINGAEVIERGWTSPIFFDRDSTEDEGCGCGAASQSALFPWLIFGGWLGRRRRKNTGIAP